MPNKIILSLADNFFRIVRFFSRKKGGDFIVIICLHKLGDSVFTIEAIRKILNIHHKQKINLFCFRNAVDIYRTVFDDLINYIEVDDTDLFLSNRIVKNKLRKILKSLNPSIIYDLTGAINSASLIFNSPSSEIIGINKRLYKGLYDYYSEIRKVPHISYIYIDALKSKYPEIDYKNSKTYKSNSNPNGKILIHPFAGWEAKEWGLSKFFELAEKLIYEHEVEFIFPPGKINLIPSIYLKKFQFSETRTTKELMDKIIKSKLLIGNDSGAVNLANLLGVPVFIIYGPSNPSFHLPLQGNSGYAQKKIECSPIHDKLCFTDGGRKGCFDYRCMNELTVNEVYESIKIFYQKIN